MGGAQTPDIVGAENRENSFALIKLSLGTAWEQEAYFLSVHLVNKHLLMPLLAAQCWDKTDTLQQRCRSD